MVTPLNTMNEHVEEIAIRAHKIYEDEGCPEGKSEEHWLRAEAELQAELDGAKSADGKKSR